MPRKKKESEFSLEDEMIKSIQEATERSKLEDLTLKFSEEEVNLPAPIEVRKKEDAVAGGKKSKPRYVRGDHFYNFLKYTRKKGKVVVAKSCMKITGETKQVESLQIVDGEEKLVVTDVHIRKQSKPSRAWLARQKKAA